MDRDALRRVLENNDDCCAELFRYRESFLASGIIEPPFRRRPLVSITVGKYDQESTSYVFALQGFSYDAPLVFPHLLRGVPLGFYSTVAQAEAGLVRILIHDPDGKEAPKNNLWCLELLKIPLDREGQWEETLVYDGDGNYLSTIQNNPAPEPFAGRDNCRYQIGEIVSLIREGENQQFFADIGIITARPPTPAKAERINARFANGPLILKPEDTGLSVSLAMCIPAATDTYQLFIPSIDETQGHYECRLRSVEPSAIDTELATRLQAHGHHLRYWEQCRKVIDEMRFLPQSGQFFRHESRHPIHFQRLPMILSKLSQCPSKKTRQVAGSSVRQILNILFLARFAH